MPANPYYENADQDEKETSDEASERREKDEPHQRLSEEAQSLARSGPAVSTRATEEATSKVDRELPGVILMETRRGLESPSAASKSSFQMPDGTYHRNSRGNIDKTVSKDGAMTRTYKYDDPADPSKITTLNMNGAKELQRTGPQSFAFYEIKNGVRTKTGDWYGDVSISKDGVLRFREKNETEYHHRGAAARDLTKYEIRNWNPDSKPEAPREGKEPKQDVRPDADKPRVAPDSGTTKDRAKDGAPSSSAFDGKRVSLPDGTYERDEQGRVRTMISPDGKTQRAFKYEDPKNPDRITTEIVNGKTEYRYLGPVTVNGQPYKENGFECNSYAIYENGSLAGNWAGVRSISRNGVFSTKEEGRAGASLKHETADGKELSEGVRKARERYGIWPSKFEVTQDDGTKYAAKLKGQSLDSVTETRTVNGEQKTINWQRSGDKWTSDERPPRERKNMEVRRDGSLRYDDLLGIKHVHHKDGRRDQVENGVTRGFDKSGKLASVTQANGESRKFGYTGNELTSITDQSKKGSTTWSRRPGSDVWNSGGRTETRKDLKISNDGSVEYGLGNGNRVRLSKDFAKVELDAKNRPVKVEFESGSTRKFEYSGDKLKSITDTVKQKDKTTTRTWTRDGDTNNFTAEYNGKKHTRQITESPSSDGDYKYSGADKKVRLDRSRDLELRARGENLFSSENLQEAKENLLDAATAKGLKTKRIEEYLTDLEKTASKWGTKPEKLAKALDSLTQIISSPETSKHYTESQRKTIFETALHNIARPMEIDQGYHPTCNVTTVEVFSAVRHPDEYARMCKEIALKGTYKSSDGKTVTPPKNALMPGEDERTYNLDEPNVDKRNLASQIVQMTLINGVYELGHYVRNGRSLTDTRYVMDKISWKSLGGGRMAKVGEDRLADSNGRPRGTSDGGPEFTQTEVLAASKMMLGYEMPYIKGPISHDGRNWKFDLPTRDRLLAAKKEDKLPLGVPTIGGQHVQTIHDVSVDKSGTLWVLLDNQHGEGKDGWVTLADLHKTQTDSNYECKPSLRRWQKVNR